ncbi:hypothetical protein [Actinoplanes sp. NPDC026623]|uniref:hypothetical protein n=1 Tax=Actinoplanes sp. NPDC026623 TaxID=3155610 RepID=UPI0033DCEA85
MNQVERLHYYNGRRLTAADFAVEQQYHLAMRRLLNHGLFTPGVVNGLEVSKVDATHVRVAPGLALDPAGRELVVPLGPDEQRTVVVPAQRPTRRAGGYFLVLRYAEERIPATEDACASPATPQAARIREVAELLWTEDFPAPGLCDPNRSSIDCAVVLALVTTTATCEIDDIVIGVRQYARPTHVSQVSAFAVEGEKDIDRDNPKVLHFQIRGGSPNSVVLQLWGDRFSTLHYTELAQHAHALSAIAVGGTSVPLLSHQHDQAHTHSIPRTADDGVHRHSILVRPSLEHIATEGPPLIPIPPLPASLRYVEMNGFRLPSDPARPFVQDSDGHGHNSGGPTGAATPATSGTPTSVAAAPLHSHTFAATVDASGTQQTRNGPPYGFLNKLQVNFDGQDITAEVVAKLPNSWGGLLGNGDAAHGLNDARGTDLLDLIEIVNAAGLVIDTGPHTLTFSVAAGGGKILYNLYVE